MLYLIPFRRVFRKWRRSSDVEYCNDRQHLTLINTLTHKAINHLPIPWHELFAEQLLRRPNSPGPASEHAMQYRLSVAKADRKHSRNQIATVAAGADQFYAKQYRQFLNPTMGAFAMSATQALLGCGGSKQGRIWQRYRPTHAAVIQKIDNMMPLWVLNKQTLAIPLLLPNLAETDPTTIEQWLSGVKALPKSYRALINGQELRCYERRVVARERSGDGTLLELLDAVKHTGKLAVLALHPHDPDAMGLHITLYDVGFVGAEQLVSAYGLPPESCTEHMALANRLNRHLVYCVGGTEEVFTQCSQNLFVKQSLSAESTPKKACMPLAWHPTLPLQRLISQQFEMIQVTVAFSGLPGASPRNGVQGKAAFVGHQHNKPVLLIPYHPGNAVHGHAAKIWTNPYASMVISDDHTALTRVIISGSARVITHAEVKRDFPKIVEQVASQLNRHGLPIAEPEYWFLQEVQMLVQEIEPLAANKLSPNRASCTISAGGEALHNKKPSYFDADSLPAYDQHLHHENQHNGRPIDAEGLEHRSWIQRLQPALEARRNQLALLEQAPL